jgi:hypothetical protein
VRTAQPPLQAQSDGIFASATFLDGMKAVGEGVVASSETGNSAARTAALAATAERRVENG